MIQPKSYASQVVITLLAHGCHCQAIVPAFGFDNRDRPHEMSGKVHEAQ